jgi:hypothetical protein
MKLFFVFFFPLHLDAAKTTTLQTNVSKAMDINGQASLLNSQNETKSKVRSGFKVYKI